MKTSRKELAKAKPKTFTTRIDLAPETREKMIRLLNQQLADTFDLYSQTKQAYWNVKGAQFYSATFPKPSINILLPA